MNITEALKYAAVAADKIKHEVVVSCMAEAAARLAYEAEQLSADRDEWKARAESAESELKKAREQEPVAYRIDWSDGLVELAWQADGYDEDYVEIRGLPTAVPLGEMPCAAPKPAAPDSNSPEIGGIKPAAPAVPEEWVIGVANLIDAFDAENAQLGKNMLAAGVTHASLSDKQAAIYVAVDRLRALFQTTGAKP